MYKNCRLIDLACINFELVPLFFLQSVLDSRLGQKPTKEKPEITVYF